METERGEEDARANLPEVNTHEIAIELKREWKTAMK